MTRGADLDPYDFSTLQSYISNLRFKSAPGPGSGGFILATLDVPQGNEVVQSSHSERDKENAEPGKPGFKVEDYHDNHKWEVSTIRNQVPGTKCESRNQFPATKGDSFSVKVASLKSCSPVGMGWQNPLQESDPLATVFILTASIF